MHPVSVKMHSPPREEGWLRHQENFGEAHLSAADGVVAHKRCFGVSNHPGRFASTPLHKEGNIPARRVLRSVTHHAGSHTLCGFNVSRSFFRSSSLSQCETTI